MLPWGTKFLGWGGAKHHKNDERFKVLGYISSGIVIGSHWGCCHVAQNSLGGGGGRKEGNILFNEALNTFYLRLYGVRHMVKDHSDSERGNPLPPHRLLFPINSKGSFICTIPQTG